MNDSTNMHNSMFWKPFMIPVYFIVAFLAFLLFKFYIQANMTGIILLIGPLIYIACASIVFNANRRQNGK